jgi:YD repeat-containing protein
MPATKRHTRGGAPALDELATLDGLGRRIGWDFTAGSLHAYKAEATRDVVGRVASLTWGFGPSAADHWRGYGYDPATRLADAWSWDGLAPGPDVSSLANHTVGPGQVGTLAGSLAGVVHAPFARAADGGDLLSIGDAYDVTSPRGPGHRLTEVEIDGVAVTVDHDATGRVVEVDPGYTFEYDPDERLMAVRDSGTGDVVEHYAYDADGRLAATYDANGLTQRFAWDGAQMVAARDGNGVAKWDAVWGTLDQLLSWRDLAAHPVGDVAVLPITDHRGSVVGAVESDAGGTTLLAAADYTPMGRVASLDPTDDDAETCREDGNLGTRCAHPGGMPFGFAGAWRSEATGLVYMRFRWYSPPPAYPRSITATTAQASPDPDPTATRTSPPVTSVSPGPSATAPAASTTVTAPPAACTTTTSPVVLCSPARHRCSPPRQTPRASIRLASRTPGPTGPPTIVSSPANARPAPSRGTSRIPSAPRSTNPAPSSTAMHRSMPGNDEKGAASGTSARARRHVHGAPGAASVTSSSVEPRPFFQGTRRAISAVRTRRAGASGAFGFIMPRPCGGARDRVKAASPDGQPLDPARPGPYPARHVVQHQRTAPARRDLSARRFGPGSPAAASLASPEASLASAPLNRTEPAWRPAMRGPATVEIPCPLLTSNPRSLRRP